MPKPGRLNKTWLLAWVASAGMAAAAAGTVQRGDPPRPPPPLPEPQGPISSELGRPGRPVLVDPATGLPVAPADAQGTAERDADVRRDERARPDRPLHRRQ